MKLVKTSEFFETVKKFSKLAFLSLLTNLMNYFDKFIIYPIFGATSIAIYYSVNSMAKIANLICNPVSNVILSWVSGMSGEKNKNKIIKATLLLNFPIILVVTLITIPLTYIALKILYSQFLNDGMILIIPVSIAVGFGIAATLIKSVLLKFSNTNALVGVYILYFIVFVICAYFLSKNNGILGFAIANLISKIVLWINFIVMLLMEMKKERGL